MFKGSNVALITPFKNDKLDEDAYINLIHFQIKNGTNGLVPAGTTGESPTLSHEEHQKVIELCIKESGGKNPIIAGTGSNSTAEAVSLTKHAEKEGADAVFDKIKFGKIKVNIVKEYKLENAKQAHEDLEARKLLGPAILIP